MDSKDCWLENVEIVKLSYTLCKRYGIFNDYRIVWDCVSNRRRSSWNIFSLVSRISNKTWKLCNRYGKSDNFEEFRDGISNPRWSSWNKDPPVYGYTPQYKIPSLKLCPCKLPRYFFRVFSVHFIQSGRFAARVCPPLGAGVVNLWKPPETFLQKIWNSDLISFTFHTTWILRLLKKFPKI